MPQNIIISVYSRFMSLANFEILSSRKLDTLTYTNDAPKYFEAFNRKKLPLFETSLMTLEYLHQTMLSFKGMRFCSMFGSNHKKVFGKLREIRPYLSPF